ncbi:MAG TPA: TIGR01620 family protein [Alphaproteobacteria bacterium]|nr:TIGR01620 family protein [Alphaproteobacteria bacterium]
MTPEAKPKAGLYPVTKAEPAPPPRLPESFEPSEPIPAIEPARRRNPAWRWVLRTVAALILGLIVLDLGLFLEGLFQRSLALGAAFALLIGAAVVAILSWSAVELRQIRKLGAVEAIRIHGAEMMARNSHGGAMSFIAEARRALANRPAVARRFDRLEDMVLETMSDRDALELFRREILLPLDAEAYAAVRRAAQWTAIGVSASPIAGLDALIALWRSLRMIRQIAEAYGLRPGPIATMSLARKVLTGVAGISAVDVMGDMWAQHLGHRVAGLISAKLAEGVYAAVRVARLGLLAMGTCRPVPFTAEDEPSLSRLRTEITGSLARSLSRVERSEG